MLVLPELSEIDDNRLDVSDIVPLAVAFHIGDHFRLSIAHGYAFASCPFAQSHSGYSDSGLEDEDVLVLEQLVLEDDEPGENDISVPKSQSFELVGEDSDISDD